ncbi:Uncharacterized protein HZ326_0140 [Fusarium oxysporum f. sp. albedinis]|nr:Uncharacterized protein HZ326_0140 [Fusarium oxysporum f. sp. albedinis]
METPFFQVSSHQKYTFPTARACWILFSEGTTLEVFFRLLRRFNGVAIANLDFSPDKTVSIKSSLDFMGRGYSCLVVSKSLSRDYQWPMQTITQLKTRFILSCYNEFEQTYINLCRSIGSTFDRLTGRLHSICQCLLNQ